MGSLIKSLLAVLAERDAHLSSVDPSDLRILVVDDEPVIVRFADRILRSAGYRPALATSGSQALAAADAMGHVDVLVTDLMMPEMTGDELARRVRAAQPDLKVLYLTGFSDRLFESKTTLWDGEAFLEKPCSIAWLEQAVSLLAYGHVAPRETAYDTPAVWR